MNKQLQIYNPSLPIGSIESYIAWVNRVPMLTVQEEQDFSHQFREQGDLEAARKLVLSHLRFVVKIARGYAGYGLPLSDLIQEGNIGLMKAVKRFDPAVGVRLVSFAVHWIKAEIHEFILRNWRIVKIATTKAQRKLFFNLRRMSKRLGWFTSDEIKEVARQLNVTEGDVRTMEARLNDFDKSFDAPTVVGDDSGWSAPVNFLEDHNADPALMAEKQQASDTHLQQLIDALQTLDSRSQDILQSRWLTEEKATLHELAAKYNVSAERIRQLEQQAMKRLRQDIAN